MSKASPSSASGFLEKRFQITKLGSTVQREIIAGFTTFAAMAYILVVNPGILKDAGMPHAALITATAVSACIATLLMAFMANLPIALAPGMGINAFFAYTICLGMGVPWQSALGFVFINGCIFLLLSVTGVREKIVNALPISLKAAVCAGVGLFIGFIGLANGGLVVDHPVTLVTLGDVSTPSVALFAFGILLTCVLVARGTPAAIIFSIAIITLIGLFIPDGQGSTITKLPKAVVSMPASLDPLFFKLDFSYVLKEPLKAVPIILTLLLVDMFDNIGTLIGVTKRAGLMDKNGRVPRLPKALAADSLAAIISSIFGTSTVVGYIESATGVQAGGRTGLANVVTAFLFLAALFLTPLILMIPSVAVAPALVVVGILMCESIREIELDDFKAAAPAILTLMAMPLTYSISTGIGFGLIALAVISLGTSFGVKKKSGLDGSIRQLGSTTSSSPASLAPFTYLLAFIFVLHFMEKWIFRSLGLQ